MQVRDRCKYEWGLYTERWKLADEKQKLEIEAKKNSKLEQQAQQPVFGSHLYCYLSGYHQVVQQLHSFSLNNSQVVYNSKIILSVAKFSQSPPSKGKLPLKHFCCHATSWLVSHGSSFLEEPKGQMQGLHIQLAAKPKYICQNSKTKFVQVRKSIGNGVYKEVLEMQLVGVIL